MDVSCHDAVFGVMNILPGGKKMKGKRRRMSGMLTDAAMGIKKALHPGGGGEKWPRKLLPLLVIALVCSNIGGMMPYGAERAVTKQIEEFEELPEDVLYQQVTEGTKKRELNLPKSLRGFVVAEASAGGVDTATPSEAKKYTASPSEAVKKEDADVTVATSSTATKTEEGEWKNIRVVWELDGSFSDGEEYDGEIPGTYVFDAVLARDTYQLSSAGLPRIIVEVLPGTDGSLITDWEWLDEQELLTGDTLSLPGASKENLAGYETIISMLPEKIRADVKKADGTASEGLEVEVGIRGWECSDYPEAGGDEGEYTFMALLPEEYGLEDGVRPLHVKVQLGGGNLYANEYSGLTITGGAVTQGVDGQIRLNRNGDYVISGTWNGELDGVGKDSEKAVLTVPNGVTANITLDGVTISTSGRNYACAFAVEAGGTANITLSGTNSLTSGYFRAGLEVPENATVTIDGDGSLTATGDYYGAGIGGSGSISNSGTIIMNGGTITANGGRNGAGIGGGGGGGRDAGNGGIVTITDGTITAKGGQAGAGIGGGGKDNSSSGGAGNGGSITIKGGTVYAYGGSGSWGNGGGAAGIGGGANNDDNIGSGGNVKISGEYTRVIATGRDRGYDIGGGAGPDNSFGGSGSLSVTDGATLEMKDAGTNVTDPEYRNCAIIDKDGNCVRYNSEGNPIASPTLLLEVSPADSVTLPDTVTLTATLAGAVPDNSNKKIEFTVVGTTATVTTDSSGKAVYTPTDLSPGTYNFNASFNGDTDNDPASATGITGYTVSLGTQKALILNGLGSAYTYGSEPFNLSTSGGSGGGAVSYVSSDSSVASVTGNTVVILKAGEFTVTATKAGDSSYAKATVTSPEVTVSEAVPNVNLSAMGGSTTTDPIILTATVSKVGTGATPTGTVTFSKNGTPLETVVLNSSGEASHTISSPSAGNHTYTAAYSGQTGYYKGASATRTIGVGLTDQTGFAISNPGAKTYGDSDFTLTATGGQSMGGVDFSVPPDNGVLTVTKGGSAKLIGAGSVRVTATKAGDSTYNEATATLDITVAPRDITNVKVSVTGSRVYTGSQLQPIFEVKDGALAITAGDYTNGYGPNVDAGTGTGSIILTGQRNYTGTMTVDFDIEKRPLSGAVITLEAASYPYTGNEIRPAVKKVAVDGIPVSGSEFEVGYVDNINEGTATITITAKAGSNFSGAASTTFMITASGGNTRNSDGSSSISTGDRTYDPKKGWVSPQTGIITGTGSGYSKWLQDETGWKLQYADGTMAAGVSVTADNGRTYERLTWELIDGAWYAFGADGYAESGLVFDPDLGGYFYIDINTGMKTGWQLIDGKWYYFNTVSDGRRGIMLVDTWVEGWYVDENGIWDGKEKEE